MKLTDSDRELLERALDSLAGRACAREAPTITELRTYEKAISLVREIPRGARRLRSDFNGRRRTAQAELPIEEPAL